MRKREPNEIIIVIKISVDNNTFAPDWAQMEKFILHQQMFTKIL